MIIYVKFLATPHPVAFIFCHLCLHACFFHKTRKKFHERKRGKNLLTEVNCNKYILQILNRKENIFNLIQILLL